MANEVTTTLVVNFRGGSASDGAIDAEVDDREDGLNGGKSSFVRGDSPVYLIFRTDDIQLVEQTPSAGFISSSFNAPVATGEVTLTEELRFVKEQQATVTRPIKDLTLSSFKWIGNNLGTPQPIDAKTIQVPTFGVGVLKVTYQSKFEAYRIDNIPFGQIDPETDYSIVVFIRGIQV